MALYYPSVTIKTSTTPLGMVISIPDTLYENPIEGRHILVIDAEQVIFTELSAFTPAMTLEEASYTQKALRDNSGLFRQLFTGQGMEDTAYRNLVTEACSVCPRLGNYILYQHIFGDPKLHGLARWLIPLRHAIDFAIVDIRQQLEDLRCAKFCMLSRDFVYYSIPYGTLPSFHYKYRII